MRDLTVVRFTPVAVKLFNLLATDVGRPIHGIRHNLDLPDLELLLDEVLATVSLQRHNFLILVSLTPESMLMWAMSDRGIPGSRRMIEGFGVHTFRLIDAQGVSRFVKFYYRPKLGADSVLWDEAVKVNGADPDVDRRDIKTTIVALVP